MLQLPKHTLTYVFTRYPNPYGIQVYKQAQVDLLTRNYIEITHPVEQHPTDVCFF